LERTACTNTFLFPDINVWLALSYPAHIHFETAEAWFRAQNEEATFVFCRHTQLGFLRLMNNQAALREDTRNQRQCWELYDRWIGSGTAIFMEEPAGIEIGLRLRTASEFASPKTWADAYLAAFAEAAGLTLVTFDRARAGKVSGSILLG